eukprot:1749129-Rhodomonas_salina.1
MKSAASWSSPASSALKRRSASAPVIIACSRGATSCGDGELGQDSHSGGSTFRSVSLSSSTSRGCPCCQL